MQQLINFSELNPATLYQQVTELIKQNNQRVAQLIKDAQANDFELNWANSAALLDDWDEELFDRLFSVAGHLKSVRDNEQLRSAFNQCLPEISAYTTALKQNKDLFLLMKKLRETADLDEEQAKDLDNYLRACRLAGIELPAKEAKEFAKLVAEHSKLTAKFSENVLDSNDKWKKHLKDSAKLQGIPQPMLDKYQQDAKDKGQDGYLIGLDMPSYQAVMTYADDRELRAEMQRAFVTRASSEDATFSKFDNTPLVQQIMLCRHQMAQLLGYQNPAEMLMATNMVTKPQKVEDFLNQLMEQVLPAAQQEAEELRDYVLQHQDSFEPWDLAYYSEKMKQDKFNIDQEQMRDYFPLPRVLPGMFKLAEELFGVKLVEQKKFDTWHEDVRLFQLQNTESGESVGYLYCDLYAREHKNGGAWMNECLLRRRLGNGKLQLPVAYLVCNFRPPSEGETLLLHYDVQVLFHELGHCLHHLLTKVSQRGVSGINGVPHDMVEVPSQLMENWCWDKEFIKLISAHYQTGEPLPGQQLDDLLAARNFHSALAMLRQLEFSLFDIILHHQKTFEQVKAEPTLAQQCYDELRAKYNPLPQLPENRFPNAFSHIFAGGYAAGYYGYKWAEVMSADIYALFEENGIYDQASAERLRQHIFERGGLGDALENFIAVRGRKPDPAAFLRYNGIGSGVAGAT